MLQGAMTALITPFRNGQIDEESLRQVIDTQLAAGIDGLVPCGTTGEAATLSHEEHHRVVEITVDTVQKRVPVVAGAGSNNTQEAIALTRHAKLAGADAALHITPYYNKPTQEGLYQHFAAIAQAVDFPIIVYNIMSRTGVNITPATMARIAKLPQVIGVKEASGDLAQMAAMIKLCANDAGLFSGDDNLTLPVLAIGGKGVISVLSNLMPAEVAGLCRMWRQGKYTEAKTRYFQLLDISNAIFYETNPIMIKTAMKLANLIVSDEMRLPLCPPQPENLNQLIAVMTAHKLIKN
jgi:4-hydroxy-tetrahydrodipicolinate synthase